MRLCQQGTQVSVIVHKTSTTESFSEFNQLSDYRLVIIHSVFKAFYWIRQSISTKNYNFYIFCFFLPFTEIVTKWDIKKLGGFSHQFVRKGSYCLFNW